MPTSLVQRLDVASRSFAAPEPQTRSAAPADLIGRLIAHGLTQEDLAPLLTDFAEGLGAAGVPVWRIQLSLPTVDPGAESLSLTWYRGEQVQRESHGFGGANREPFLRSPFYRLVAEGLPGLRWRLPDRTAEGTYPILAELAARGARDYLVRLVPFGTVGDQRSALRGLAVSIATMSEGGFAEDALALIDRVLPAFALAAYRIVVQQVATTVLDAYVGPRAGRRVFAGEIERGAVSTMHAVLMFADLRGFTALADEAPGEALVGWLNEHFDAIAAPVEAQGGEILKFLGDGLLAVFDAAEDVAGSCRRASAAALAALAANRSLNAARRAAGGPALELDVALHLGLVRYGNIGAHRRLDFTVIGPAVNEASRIEALCGPLGRHLLMSSAFATAANLPVVSLGRHSLRGVAEHQEIFSLDAPEATAC